MSPHDTITPVVGLEIHVELATATKMFCRCRNQFGDEPNTHVCPVCTSMPGALPVMNRLAVEYSMTVAMALNCTVAEYTKWDRKNYYYPDLPKGYQISQYDLPIGENGWLKIPLDSGESKKIGVLRAHLEEDAGKNTHDLPGCTGVDLNRAGVPLLEIVSQPDMNTTEQVMGYARAMQRLVRWLGVSEANMQMGHMRFEPNINLHITRDGQTFKTPIVEVKNLNSFRSLQQAVDFELSRQYEQWQGDPSGYTLEKLGKQNRGFDDAIGQTIFQREKEEAHDYRYFPDPDLPAVVVDASWRQRVGESIGELPLARRQRYMEQYGLSFKDADALTLDQPTGLLLDGAVAVGADAKRCANLLLGKLAAEAKQRDLAIGEVGISPEQLGQLACMLQDGEINATAAEKIMAVMIDAGGQPRAIAEQQNLLAVKDTAQIDAWIDQALQANADAVATVKEGGKKQQKAFGFLMGQVMQASRGAAPPQEVRQRLQEKIDQAD
jgi:aspartyl-tRNA(Asn)/glutamyl-tRNA(Gln) amidotransferase subunit B